MISEIECCMYFRTLGICGYYNDGLSSCIRQHDIEKYGWWPAFRLLSCHMFCLLFFSFSLFCFIILLGWLACLFTCLEILFVCLFFVRFPKREKIVCSVLLGMFHVVRLGPYFAYVFPSATTTLHRVLSISSSSLIVLTLQPLCDKAPKNINNS